MKLLTSTRSGVRVLAPAKSNYRSWVFYDTYDLTPLLLTWAPRDDPNHRIYHTLAAGLASPCGRSIGDAWWPLLEVRSSRWAGAGS